MIIQETLLASYLREFKASARLESVNASNLFLNHEAAAKALGLSSVFLGSLRHQAEMPCAFYYNPLTDSISSIAATMYSIETLTKYIDKCKNFAPPRPIATATSSATEDPRLIIWNGREPKHS